MQAQALAPLFIIILAYLMVLTTASIYRSVFPEEEIRKAVDTVSRYRTLKLEAERSKRKQKKLRGMEPEYREAKRLLLKGFVFKTVIFMLTYVLGSLLFIYTMPAIISPYHIPGVTVRSDEICAAPSFILFFIAYMMFYFIHRDSFL